jgi:hypothetical protein
MQLRIQTLQRRNIGNLNGEQPPLLEFAWFCQWCNRRERIVA